MVLFFLRASRAPDTLLGVGVEHSPLHHSSATLSTPRPELGDMLHHRRIMGANLVGAINPTPLWTLGRSFLKIMEGKTGAVAITCTHALAKPHPAKNKDINHPVEDGRDLGTRLLFLTDNRGARRGALSAGVLIRPSQCTAQSFR